MARASFVDTNIALLHCHGTQIDLDGPFSQLPKEMTRDTLAILVHD
jgi:hypothetical protein